MTKLSVGFLLLVTLFSSHVFTATVRVNERSVVSDVQQAVEKVFSQLKQELEGFALSTDQVSSLLDELKQQVVKVPAPKIDIYHPIQSAKDYVKKVEEFLQEVYDKIIQKAKEIEVEVNGVGVIDIRDTGKWPLPGIRDQLDDLQKDLESKIGKFDLYDEQREELVRELFQKITDYPNEHNVETLKPSEVKEYVKKIRAYAQSVIKDLVEKAKTLEERNRTGEGIIEPREIRIPILSDIIDGLKEKFEATLNHLTGLTRPQRKELLQEFGDKIKNFPLISGWDLVSPSKIVEYVKEIKDYGKHVIDTLVAKAKAFIEQNKGEASGATIEERSVKGWRLPGLRDIIESVLARLDKALEDVTGLTKEQREELSKELLDEIKNYPNANNVNILRPSQVKKYFAEVNEFADKVIESLKIKARAFVESNNKDRSERGVLTDVDNKISELTDKLKKDLKNLKLTAKQVEDLMKDLVKDLVNIPLPKIDFAKPIESAKQYAKEVDAYLESVFNKISEKAKKIEWRNVTGEGVIEPRSVPLPGMVELLEELDGLLKSALDELKDLNGQKRSQLMKEYRDHLKNFANIEGWHTLKPSMLGQYKKEITEFAQKYVEVQVAKAKEYMEKNNNSKRAVKGWALPGIRDELDDLQKDLESKIGKMDLYDEQREELVRELFQRITDYPNEHNIETLKPSEVTEYVKKIRTYAQSVIKDLVEKAKTLEDRNRTGEGIIEPREIRIPILSDIIDSLKEKFEATLNHLTGLTRPQRKELLQEFGDKIKNFPLISGWDLISPSKIAEYIKEIKEYGKHVIDTLVAKAKAFIEQNKGEASGAVTEERSIPKWQLPSLRDIGETIKSIFHDELKEFTCLTKEQREKLEHEYRYELSKFLYRRDVNTLKPSEAKKYYDDTIEFARCFIESLKVKARAFEEINGQNDRSKRGLFTNTENNVNDYIDKLKVELKNLKLDAQQIEKLMDELVQDLKNVPLPKVDFAKPIESAKAYAKEVEAFLKNVYEKTLEKAKKMEWRNISGEGVIEPREIRIPILSDILDGLKEKFEATLNHLTGLTRPQRKELVQEFGDKIKNFPLISGWDLVSPSKIVEYIKEIKDYGKHVIDSLVEKAKAFIEQNKGEASGATSVEKRDIFGWRLPGIRDLIEKAQARLTARLDKVTGLTKDQREELAKELRQELTDFPNANNVNILVPSEVWEYVKRVDKFMDSVIEGLQLKAQAMVEQNKEKKTEKRAIELPQFVKDIQDRIVQTFRTIVTKITGLTAEEQDEIVAEFKEDLSHMPIPPYTPWDFFNPIKFAKYIGDLTKYNIELTRKYLKKATDWVKEKVSGGKDKIKEHLGQEKRGIEIPEAVQEIQDRLIQSFSNAVYHYTGLSDEQQHTLIEEFKEGLRRVPIPPFKPWDFINPYKIGKYLYEVTDYSIGLTTTLFKKAASWVKGETEGIEIPDVTKDIEQRDIRLPSISGLVEFMKKQFKAALGHVSGLTPEETDALIQEFVDQLNTFPTLSFSDLFSPEKLLQYAKDLKNFSLKLTSTLLEKAKVIVDHHVDKEKEKEKREVDIPVVSDVLRKIREAFKVALDKVGLTAEKRDELVQQFNDFIHNFPSTTVGQLLNPEKLIEYLKQLKDFGKNAVETFIEKAKAIANHAISHDAPSEETEIVVKVPGTDQEVVIDANVEKVKQYIQDKLEEWGLSKENQEKLLEELKVFLDNHPKQPTGWAAVNPMNWVDYYIKRNKYLAETVFTILKKAGQLAADKLNQ